VDFRVEPAAVQELREGDPREVVLENALRKARAVEGACVLGADTEVVLGAELLGKPADAQEAERFLRRLAGRDHQVMSGLVLRSADGEQTEVAVTRVRFRPLSEEEIAWYLDTGEWRDRAGGYAIQGRGAALVDSIEGDYWNVVGLPLPALLRLMPGLLR
jgi:septum formation protein